MAFPTISDTLTGGPASQAIQEVIGKSTREYTSKGSRIFRDAILAQMAAGSADGIGRDLKWARTFMQGRAGVVKQGGLTNYVEMTGDATRSIGEKLFQQRVVETWPDPEYGVQGLTHRLEGTLHSMQTNLMFSLGELNLEANPNCIRSFLMPKVRGHGETIGDIITQAWWGDRENQFRLCSVKVGTAVWATTGTGLPTLTFETTEEVTRRLSPGLPVDIFTGNSPDVRINEDGSNVRVPAFVYSVDDWHNKVTICFIRGDSGDVVAEDGSTSYSGATMSAKMDNSEAGDGAEYITHANVAGAAGANSSGMYSVYDWLKFPTDGSAADADKYLLGSAASGTAATQVDVTVHEQFRSGKWANVGDLTERKLYKYLQRAHYAFKRYGHTIDSLYFSFGILARTFALQQAQEMLDRTGRVATVNKMGLDGEYSISVDGMTYTATTEEYLEKGRVVGLKTRDNWEILTPNDGRGVSKASNSEVPNKVPFRFIGKALGNASDLIPITKAATATGSNLSTEASMMPGMIRMQMVVKENGQVPGFMLTDVNTETVFAD